MGDAAEAHQVAIANGGVSVVAPEEVNDKASGDKALLAEVQAYGDVVLRFVSGAGDRHHLPGFVSVEREGPTFGLQRIDHCFGNVPDMSAVVQQIMAITGVLLSLLLRGIDAMLDGLTQSLNDGVFGKPTACRPPPGAPHADASACIRIAKLLLMNRWPALQGLVVQACTSLRITTLQTWAPKTRVSNP